MYKHIKVNSVFNFLFCFINAFSLINLCIFPKLSYCSSIYKNEISQYFKIYLLIFFGNSIKLCCNFSYIAFSVSRFYLASSSPSKYLKKFQDLNLRRFYCIVFLVSVLFSLFKIFQFKVNEFYSNFDLSFPFDAYSPTYCGYNRDDGKERSFTKNCKLFDSLNIAYNVLNNVAFVVINIFIDILMIRFTNQNLKRKRNMSRDDHACTDAVMLKAKVKKMVIVNGSLYFLAHIPEFTVTLLLIIFDKKLFEFCYVYFSCNELIEISEGLSFFSIIFQLFIFLKFDKNFRESFEDIFKIKR